MSKKRVWKKRAGALLLSIALLGSMFVPEQVAIAASTTKATEVTKEFKLTGDLGDGKTSNKKKLTLKMDKSGKRFEAIVMYKNKKGRSLALKLGKLKDKSLDDLGILVLQVDEKKFTQLSKSKDIQFIEKNITDTVATATPDLSPLGEMISLEDGEQASWGHERTGILNAHEKGYTGKGVKIAILDSGISKHDELSISGGISYVDYTTSYSDDHGHGTHVAGIIAAKKDGKGIVGVAPDASIYAVKVIGSNGKGDVINFIKGINWAIDNNMDVINMSIGTTYNSPIFQMVVKRAVDEGVTVVAAAGNNGVKQKENILYPGNYPETITVSSLGRTDQISDFSSNGANVDFAAPGERIVSTANDGRYEGRSGTSMAAPYVTGMIAILKESENYVTPKQFDLRLQMGVEDLGSKGRDSLYGHGLANLLSFYSDSEQPEAQPPVEVTPPPTGAINERDLINAQKFVDYVLRYDSFYYLGRVQDILSSIPASGPKDELLIKLHQANYLLDVPLSDGSGGVSPQPQPQPEPVTPQPVPQPEPQPEPQPTPPQPSNPGVDEPYISNADIQVIEKWLGYAERYRSAYYYMKAMNEIHKLPESKVKRDFQARLHAIQIN